MNKYIMKNCPALLKGTGKWANGFKESEYYCIENGDWCKNCYDCLLKQIRTLCKEDCVIFADGKVLRYDTLDEILNLMEIEEIEDVESNGK